MDCNGMTLWIAYVTTHNEAALVEDCEALGLDAVSPRKVDAVRSGNNRWPEPRVSPYLPNYVFVWADQDAWHWVNDIRYVLDLMPVPHRWEVKVKEFIDTVENTFARRMDEIEAAQRIIKAADATKDQRRQALRMMQQYQPADLLEVIAGPFAGQIAEFGALADRGRGDPEIEATVAGLRVRFDPLSVRRAG